MMESSRSHFGAYQFLLIIIQLVQIVRGESAGCGSLVTYRQYTVLLDQAPQCYRHGCGTGNTSLTTISSSCSPLAPCYGLWKLISDRFHSDWCESCPHHDVACRIRGWPILNTTSMCQSVPNDWIFYSDGDCCNSGTEPFEIAKWIGRMCDETWRDPFKFYGGMAKEDWEEWVQPWNWTVRPLNSTNQPTLQPQCPGASSYLRLFFKDTIITLVEAVFEACWKYWRYNRQKDNPNKKTRQRRFWRALQALWLKLPYTTEFNPDVIQWFVVGVGHALQIIVSSIWSAAIVHNTPGYQHVSIVRLAVLFCARPRMVWMACLLILISHEVFVNAALSVALAEWILQVVGACYLFSTTNTGHVRDFYHLNHLTPFWRGYDAHVMYSGSLFWAVVFGFFLVAFGVFMFFGKQLLRGVLFLQEAALRSLRSPNTPVDSLAISSTVAAITAIPTLSAALLPRISTLRVQVRQQPMQATTENLLSRMHRWSRRRINRYRNVPSEIPLLCLPPRLRQWERQQWGRLVTGAEEINTWFYVSERRQASGQPYLQVQQHDPMDPEPVGRGRTSAPIMQVDGFGIQRKRDGAKITVTVAFFMGMCTFAAQVMFWDGFIKSSGDRWCPPDLDILTTIFAIFNFFGISLSILGTSEILTPP